MERPGRCRRPAGFCGRIAARPFEATATASRLRPGGKAAEASRLARLSKVPGPTSAVGSKAFLQRANSTRLTDAMKIRNAVAHGLVRPSVGSQRSPNRRDCSPPAAVVKWQGLIVCTETEVIPGDELRLSMSGDAHPTATNATLGGCWEVLENPPSPMRPLDKRIKRFKKPLHVDADRGSSNCCGRRISAPNSHVAIRPPSIHPIYFTTHVLQVRSTPPDRQAEDSVFALSFLNLTFPCNERKPTLLQLATSIMVTGMSRIVPNIGMMPLTRRAIYPPYLTQPNHMETHTASYAVAGHPLASGRPAAPSLRPAPGVPADAPLRR